MEKRETPYYFRKVNQHRKISIFPKKLIGHFCLIIPLKFKTRKELDNLRACCKVRTQYCKFSFLGKNCVVYTNGFTAQLKPMIPLIKKNVFEDCIKNPRKYLGETKNESR